MFGIIILYFSFIFNLHWKFGVTIKIWILQIAAQGEVYHQVMSGDLHLMQLQMVVWIPSGLDQMGIVGVTAILPKMVMSALLVVALRIDYPQRLLHNQVTGFNSGWCLLTHYSYFDCIFCVGGHYSMTPLGLVVSYFTQEYLEEERVFLYIGL